MFAGIYFLGRVRAQQPQDREILREGGEATGMRRRQGCIVRNKAWIVGIFVGYSEAAKKDSDTQSLFVVRRLSGRISFVADFSRVETEDMCHTKSLASLRDISSPALLRINDSACASK